MFEQILLLFIGGLVTFAVTVGLRKLTSRRPILVWRALPAIHLNEQAMTALQLEIANEGDAPATGVRVVIEVPGFERLASVEIQPSEKALTVIRNDEDPLDFVIPQLPSHSILSVSCVVYGANVASPEASLVGEGGLVGAQETSMSERWERLRKRMFFVYSAVYTLMGILTVLFVAWALFLGHAQLEQRQQFAIGDLYFKGNDFEAARELYAAVPGKWIVPTADSATLRLAAVAVMEDRIEAAASLLGKIPEERIEAARYMLSDPVFDAVRDSSVFKRHFESRND